MLFLIFRVPPDYQPQKVISGQRALRSFEKICTALQSCLAHRPVKSDKLLKEEKTYFSNIFLIVSYEKSSQLLCQLLSVSFLFYLY